MKRNAKQVASSPLSGASGRDGTGRYSIRVEQVESKEGRLSFDEWGEAWDSVLIAHHRERIEWHTERLRELGVER